MWLLAVALCCPLFGQTQPSAIEGAFDRMYNFDFAGSHALLDPYIAAHPRDPVAYSVRASAYLFYELDRLGILESEFLVDDDRIADKRKQLKPDPNVRAQMQKALDETQRLAEATLATDPNDRTALFAMCIAQGVTTDYMAFVEKRQISSLSPARKSSDYAQRLLKLDSKYYDAYLTAGISEYMLGSLPFFIRWFVHFDNVAGNKQIGVTNLKLVAEQGHYLRPFAKILLAIIYLREKRPQDTRRLLTELAREYPSNPLIRNELAKLTTSLGAAGN